MIVVGAAFPYIPTRYPAIKPSSSTPHTRTDTRYEHQFLAQLRVCRSNVFKTQYPPVLEPAAVLPAIYSPCYSFRTECSPSATGGVFREGNISALP